MPRTRSTPPCEQETIGGRPDFSPYRTPAAPARAKAFAGQRPWRPLPLPADGAPVPAVITTSDSIPNSITPALITTNNCIPGQRRLGSRPRTSKRRARFGTRSPCVAIRVFACRHYRLHSNPLDNFQNEIFISLRFVCVFACCHYRLHSNSLENF